MHTTNYFNTFIEVAEDCPIETAEVPKPKGSEKTMVQHQFEIIRNNPYAYTSDDVLFSLHAIKNKLPEDMMNQEREKFFAKGQACMRASTLTKRYGWGVHCNAEGKIAIYPLESAEYQHFLKEPALKHVKAMRSKKA